MSNSEMLDMGDFNFIIVDWSKCSKKIRYKIAVVCSKTVGHYTAQLLQFIMRETRFDIKNLHLLGHSLGAQAMSFVSDYFKDPKIPRISGLGKNSKGNARSSLVVYQMISFLQLSIQPVLCSNTWSLQNDWTRQMLTS